MSMYGAVAQSVLVPGCMKTSVKLILIGVLALSFTPLQGRASAAIATSEIAKLQAQLEKESAYRRDVDAVAEMWARDLMQMYKYKWNDLVVPFSGDWKQAMRTRMAWSVLVGHGALAPFDWVNGDQSALGSKSHFTKTLLTSLVFARAVRAECLSIRPQAELGECWRTLKRGIEITQAVGSNATLFLGSAAVAKVSMKVLNRFAAEWVATRLVPVLAAVGSKPVLNYSLKAAMIVLPIGLIVMAVRDEVHANEDILGELEASIAETLAQIEKDKSEKSVLFWQSLEMKKNVLQFSTWLHARVRKGDSGASLKAAIESEGPQFSELCRVRSDVIKMGESLERELSDVATSSQTGSETLKAKVARAGMRVKAGTASAEEKSLFEKAQYLAAIRVTAPALQFCTQ